LTFNTSLAIIHSMVAATYPTNMAEMRVKNIPEALWKEFKILCIREDSTLNNKIIELVKEAVAKGKRSG
jgi:hypothetical protein